MYLRPKIRNFFLLVSTQIWIKSKHDPELLTWKKPQSLQAEWSDSNSEPMDSPWSKQWRSMTGTGRSPPSVAASIGGSCWVSRYRGGTLEMGCTASSLTLGTIMDFPNPTCLDSVSIKSWEIPLVRLRPYKRVWSRRGEAILFSLRQPLTILGPRLSF